MTKSTIKDESKIDSPSSSSSPSIISKPTKPRRYSDKLYSLLNYLDEQNNDSINNSNKYDDGGGEIGGVTSTSSTHDAPARTGLVDITNASERSATFTRSSKEKKTLKDNNDHVVAASSNESKTHRRSRSKPLQHVTRREKKYIWDDWETTLDGDIVSLQEDKATTSNMSSGDALEQEKKKTTPPNNSLPVDMERQLAELKLMSEEIQTRSTAMKLELEHKTKKVEELHSIRVQNESEHVLKMKSVKQEWKKRIEVTKEEHGRVMSEQEQLRGTLAKDCDALEKKLLSLQSDIERTTKSEQDICERLKREGAQALEDARKSWQQSEREELKKRDQKLSPKLKRDAADAVEPKLRQLMDRNKEDTERLEREAARELDCYKLELYKRSNEEYRRETNKIRAEERDRVSYVQHEWLAKLENSRRQHEDETNKIRKEFEEKSALMRQQFHADKQKCINEHEAALEDAQHAEEMEMERIANTHEREMSEMETEHADKMVDKKRSCEEEFKEWKVTREAELQKEQDGKAQDEYTTMKSKIQSDINMVKQKLKEERAEKMRQLSLERHERIAAIKEKHDREAARLRHQLQQATDETTALRRKEEEESDRANKLQRELSSLKKSVQDQEDKVISQERRLASFIAQNEQSLIEIQQAGERRIGQARCDKVSKVKELDKLIDNIPKQREAVAKELDDLRHENETEIELAESKIHNMLESKKSMLEKASAKLLGLQQETANIEKEMDTARKSKLLVKKGLGRRGKSSSTKS